MQLYHANDLFKELNNGVFGTKVLLFSSKLVAMLSKH